MPDAIHNWAIIGKPYDLYFKAVRIVKLTDRMVFFVAAGDGPQERLGRDKIAVSGITEAEARFAVQQINIARAEYTKASDKFGKAKQSALDTARSAALRARAMVDAQPD